MKVSKVVFGQAVQDWRNKHHNYLRAKEDRVDMVLDGLLLHISQQGGPGKVIVPMTNIAFVVGEQDAGRTDRDKAGGLRIAGGSSKGTGKKKAARKARSDGGTVLPAASSGE